MAPSAVAFAAALAGSVAPPLAEPNAAIRLLLKESPLLATSAEDKAQVDSWLSAANHNVPLDALNEHLSTRAFLCGGRFTFADIAVYLTVPSSALAKHPNVARWFDQIQHQARAMAPPGFTDLPPLVKGPAGLSASAFPLPAAALGPAAAAPGPAAAASAAAAATAASAPAGKQPAAAAPPATTEPSAEPAAAAAAAANGAPAAEQGKAPAAKAGGKQSKKEKKAAAAPAAAADPAAVTAAAAATTGSGGGADDGADPSKLDIRVGVIVKVWPHPEADKLFCEEIDVGEAKPRSIASGLRPFYKQEELEGRRVIILANLKPRTMVGFKSEGMVLCASSADHSQVKLVEPPAAAAPGARVTVPGFDGEPASASQLAKKKNWERCAPLLATDAEGIPGFKGAPLTVEGAGVCTSALPSAHVG